MDFERPVWRRQLPFRKRARHGLKAPLYNNVIALLKIDRTGNVSAPEPSYEIHTVNIDGDGLSIGGFEPNIARWKLRDKECAPQLANERIDPRPGQFCAPRQR